MTVLELAWAHGNYWFLDLKQLFSVMSMASKVTQDQVESTQLLEIGGCQSQCYFITASVSFFWIEKFPIPVEYPVFHSWWQ